MFTGRIFSCQSLWRTWRRCKPSRMKLVQHGEVFLNLRLAAFWRVQMQIRRTPSGATLLPRRRRITASDGWELALTNERADRRRSCRRKQSVGYWNNSCGYKDLVAMEMGCDYGDLGSIESLSQPLFQIRARLMDSANKMSGTLFTRPPC